MKINFFRIDVESTIEMLEHYLFTMEKQLSEIQKQEFDRINKRLQSIKDSEEAILYEDLAGDEYHYTYEVMFPRSLRYSYIVLLFLNLENILSRFCDTVMKQNSIPIRSKELKGDFVASSRTYVHKLAGVPEIDKIIWDNVEDLSKVRNCIVHALGEVELVSAYKTRINDIAKLGVGLSVGDADLEKGFIVLSRDYCTKAVSDVATLMKALSDKAGFGPAINP